MSLGEPTRILVLEGGGMRGVYTSGVLEAFSEANGGKGLFFPTIVGCSAGACAALSYVAGQPERNRRVYLDFLDQSKLVSYRRLLTGGNVMDIDYLAREVTLRLCPLDLASLRASRTRLHIGVTDWETGESRYLTNHEDDIVTAIQATCALPFFYRGEVLYRGRRYVDGGVSDPVPVAKAIDLGGTEVVVVLTSAIEKRGRKGKLSRLLDRLFVPSPAVRRALAERHLRYRDTASLLHHPPAGVRVEVIRPRGRLPVKRTTTRRSLLQEGCDLGYEDGLAFLSSAGLR